MKTKTRSKWLALLLTVTLLMSLFVGIVKAGGRICRRSLIQSAPAPNMPR